MYLYGPLLKQSTAKNAQLKTFRQKATDQLIELNCVFSEVN